MTFSIAAYDPISSACGIAVSSCVPAVGAAIPFVSLDGAIATQSRFNYALGAYGLQALALGIRIDDTLRALLANDPAPQLRQVHGVDRFGHTFLHSGDEVKDWKGGSLNAERSVAGNTLVGEEVVEAMASGYDDHPDAPFAERLLLALEAGQDAGGDRRGRQSAALLIAAPEVAFHHNLRVDDHPDPVHELRRVYHVAHRLGIERQARPRHVPLRLKL